MECTWRRRWMTVALLLFLTLCAGPLSHGLAAVGSSASQDAGEGAYLTPMSNLPFDPAKVGLQTKWTQRIPGAVEGRALRGVYSTPPMLFAETMDANLLALDPKKGTWIGGVSLIATLDKPPVVKNGRVYAISRGRLLRIDIQHGEVQKEIRIQVVPSAPLEKYEDSLLVASEKGEVIRIDPETGAEEWSITPGGSVRGRLLIHDDMVYAVAYQGGVTGAHAKTGRIRWSWSPAEAKICACVPAASEGRIFAGDDHGFVHCLDGDIGFPYWRYPTGAPVEECVTLPGDKMLITTYKSETLCLSSGESPELLWTHPDSSTFVVQGKGKVYLLTRDNELCAVSIDGGEELWRRSLPEGMKAVGGSQKGHFYLYTDEGSILALSEYK